MAISNLKKMPSLYDLILKSDIKSQVLGTHASKEVIKTARETQIQLWARLALNFNLDCNTQMSQVYKDLQRFTIMQEQSRSSLWGTYASIALTLAYIFFIISILQIYAQNRFKKIDRSQITLIMAGSGLAVSAAIYGCLLIPILPLTSRLSQLQVLYDERDCFKYDKYMQLNGEEEYALNIPLHYLCMDCIVADFLMIALFLVVYGKTKFHARV